MGLQESSVALVGSMISTQSHPANVIITQQLHSWSFTLWKLGLPHEYLELEEETVFNIPPSASAGFFKFNKICGTMSHRCTLLL